MPTISMFYGIFIRLYYAPDEHPPAHFHAYYAEYKATINIDTCEIIKSNLPSKQQKIVLAWAVIHQNELKKNWGFVMAGKPPFKITPLN